MRQSKTVETSKAFALPTVLIASIVLLTILAVSVTATAAVRTTLKNQYYIQLAQVAGESGVAYAKACLAANANIPQWTNAKPLTPATDCTGTNQLPGGNSDCPADPACSVTIDGNVRSSFSVPKPTVDGNGKALTIPNNGYVDILRTSNGAVWRTYKQPSVQAAVVPDLCSGNATSARGWGAAVKTTQQDALPSASTAQTISIADAAINAGSVYYRKDFNAGQAGTYDINVYTPTSQDVATTYIDGQPVNFAAGSLATSQVSLTGGCHVMVTVLVNDTYIARASDFTASVTKSGEAVPAAVTDTTWRVSAGDPTHFSQNNYEETANSWEPVAVRGAWNNTALPWGGNPTNWASVSGDNQTQWISTAANSSGNLAPAAYYALFRSSQPFTLASADTVRVSTYCDYYCDLYLDGDLIQSASYSLASKSITIQPGTHTFGMRLKNDGAAPNSSGFLFSAYDLTSGAVISHSDPGWDATTSWYASGAESYSYDASFTPTPAVQSTVNAKILVVGGGGGGGSDMGGGGGGGAVIYNAAYPLAAGVYNVVVGSGGSGGPAGQSQVRGANGANSSFGKIRALGGGGGGSEYANNNSPPGAGASAGGSAGCNQNLYGGFVIGQGNGSAGTPGCYYPTGGGGAGGFGAANPATGGVGVANNILGTSYFWGGGGGGSGYTGAGGNGGNGGGAGGPIGSTVGGSGLNNGGNGKGGAAVTQANVPGSNGGANTGGGGSGGSHYNANNYGGTGGSGVVVISYPTGIMTATGGTITTSGGNTIHTFTSSGTFTVTSTVAPLAFDTNISPPFSQWILSGGATYNGGTGEITLPTSAANAYSPFMRVENSASMTAGASFYATTTAATFTPQGGFLLGSEYFAADLSPVNNSAGYQNNGCARAVALNSLAVMPTTCSFAGGPDVKYVRIHYSGSSTYTSTGIKVSDPSTIFTQ